jgi:hypothetical protein
MQAIRVPARRGFDWIIEGYRLFAKNPLVTMSLIVVGLGLLISANAYFLGACAIAVLTPSIKAALLDVFRQVESGAAIDFKALLARIRGNFRTLLVLGVIYLGITVASLGLTLLADDGVYFKFRVLGEIPPDMPKDRAPLGEMVFMLCMMPGALLCLWFAPMLAAWNRLPALQSLFFAAVALVRNYRAFIVFSISVSMLCMIALMLVALVIELVGSTDEDLYAVALLPAMIIVVAIVTAGNYISYRDIFREQADPAAPEAV